MGEHCRLIMEDEYKELSRKALQLDIAVKALKTIHCNFDDYSNDIDKSIEDVYFDALKAIEEVK